MRADIKILLIYSAESSKTLLEREPSIGLKQLFAQPLGASGVWKGLTSTEARRRCCPPALITGERCPVEMQLASKRRRRRAKKNCNIHPQKALKGRINRR